MDIRWLQVEATGRELVLLLPMTLMVMRRAGGREGGKETNM